MPSLLGCAGFSAGPVAGILGAPEQLHPTKPPSRPSTLATGMGTMNETARAVERCAQAGTWTDDRYTARETEVRIGVRHDERLSLAVTTADKTIWSTA